MFREVAYTLLGLIMNLCLEGPFVSQVQCSCHPPWSPGTDMLCWLIHVFMKSTETCDPEQSQSRNMEGWRDALSLC